MRANRYGSNATLLDLYNFSLIFVLLYTSILKVVVTAFSETKPRRKSKPPPSLHVTLQSCFTPVSILENVAVYLSPKVDSSGALSSLTLVRLSKQLISLDNKRNNLYRNDTSKELLILNEEKELWKNGLNSAIDCLVSSDLIESQKSLDVFVEGIKSASVISRLLRPKIEANDDINGINCSWWTPLFEKIHEEDNHLAAVAQPHQLSGLKWSIDCFRLSIIDSDFSCELPRSLQQAYDDLDLPFAIRPGFLTKTSDCNKFSSAEAQSSEYNLFSVASFIKQVDFLTEKIQTNSKRAVVERRQTAWQGDDNVPPFEYSGKSMERVPWSAVVGNVRDRLHEETSHYYDGCLLNLYPDGGSGMRYHIDPDQGIRWDFETAVVSIGASRRFAFRPMHDNSDVREGMNDSKPHLFVVMDGDVTEMVRDCQDRFQHTVKTAEFKGESAPRVSLVFKKTLDSR